MVVATVQHRSVVDMSCCSEVLTVPFGKQLLLKTSFAHVSCLCEKTGPNMQLLSVHIDAANFSKIRRPTWKTSPWAGGACKAPARTRATSSRLHKAYARLVIQSAYPGSDMARYRSTGGLEHSTACIQ